MPFSPLLLHERNLGHVITLIITQTIAKTIIKIKIDLNITLILFINNFNNMDTSENTTSFDFKSFSNSNQIFGNERNNVIPHFNNPQNRGLNGVGLTSNNTMNNHRSKKNSNRHRPNNNNSRKLLNSVQYQELFQALSTLEELEHIELIMEKLNTHGVNLPILMNLITPEDLKTMNIPIGPAVVLRYHISLYRNGK